MTVAIEAADLGSESWLIRLCLACNNLRRSTALAWMGCQAAIQREAAS